MLDFVNDSLKFKVLLGYIFSFMAVLLACYIVMSSYSSLNNSISKLFSPNVPMMEVNNVLTGLSEAENSFQLFSVSNQTYYLRKHKQKISIVKTDLQNLKLGKYNNFRSYILIDSMCLLLNNRDSQLNKYLVFLRRKSNNLTDSLHIKLSLMSDSIRTKIVVNTTKKLRLDTLKTILPNKKQGFLSRLFGGKNQKVDKDTLRTVVARVENTIDSTFILKPDSLLRNVDSLISIAKKKQRLNKRIIAYKTTKLIKSNAIIIHNLKLLVKELEEEYLLSISQELDATKLIANRSIMIISVVLSMGFIMSVAFIVLVFRDITRSNYYKSKLIQAKQNAEHFAMVKEEFLANMSHEIRTPLNSIIGFTRLLKKTHVDFEQNNCLEIIDTSSNHLLNIVNDILNLSKLQDGHIKFNYQTMNPYALIQEIYNSLLLSADNKGLAFSFVFVGDKSINFVSDSFRIKQLLINILNNAIKFTDKGEIILQVNLEQTNKSMFKLIIDITDTGIGIKKENLESIFDNFSQAELFTDKSYGGTGLGLSISKRIIQLLGGSLNVESEYDKGSTFLLNIPLEISNEDLVFSAPESILLPDELSEKKFLIADDDKYSLLLIRKILENYNLHAHYVNNGSEAIEKLKTNSYDLIITDINMPEIGGLELCRYVRSNADIANTPIVCLTANVRENDIAKYIKEGMDSCLIKPLNEKDLIVEICKYTNTELAIKTNNKIDVIDDNMYSISNIQTFIGDDKELLAEIMSTFISEAKVNCNNLRVALSDKNYNDIGSIAHKMLSSYNQFEVVDIIPLLVELDNVLHKSNNTSIDEEYITSVLNKALELSSKLIQEMENNLDDLSI